MFDQESEGVVSETPAQMSTRIRGKLMKCHDFWTQIDVNESLRTEILYAVARAVKEHSAARTPCPAAVNQSPFASRAHRRRSVVTRADGIYGDIQKMIEKLNDQWDLIDLEESSRTSRIAIAFKDLQQVLEKMLESETAMVRDIHLEIDDLLRRVSTMRAALQLPRFNVDEFTPNSIALYRALEVDLRELEERRKKIVEEQTTVSQRAATLARRLGRDDSDLPEPNQEIVDIALLDRLVEETKGMEAELTEKIAKLRDFQDDIRTFYRRMRLEPSMENNTAFLIDVNLDDDDCIITDSLLLNMEATAEAARQEYNDWLANLGFAYDEEMMKLADLRLATMTSTGEGRFPAQFDPETQDGDAIYAVRSEVERLQHVYDVGKEVFEALKKWRAHWNEKVEYERASAGVGRYNNRGGVLELQLKHQRALEKQLIPAAIRDVATAYQQLQHHNPGIDVNIHGSRLSPPEYVQFVMDSYEKEKLLEKTSKSTERKRQHDREKGVTTRTPAKKRLAKATPNPTPTSTSTVTQRRPLRTMPETPSTSTSSLTNAIAGNQPNMPIPNERKPPRMPPTSSTSNTLLQRKPFR